MADIILTTLNAKYIHASFGLRYLKANLGDLSERSIIMEFQSSDRCYEIAEKILANNPKIIGFGIYIWNAIETKKLVKLINKISPDTILIAGGPEISHETSSQDIVDSLDYIVTGEADISFKELCEKILIEGTRPEEKIISSALPELENLALPYSLYSDDDVQNRIVYVEASRGCPFTCEFCLSSLEIPVRTFSLEKLLPEFEKLLDRGVKHFKFVDRTFNLNIKTSNQILSFFKERYRPGLFLHFEMIPDRLPPQLRESIASFPPGVLQFEVGIQSFNVEVNKLISRRQDFTKLADNIRFLTQETGVHIHADLIVGLPGEDIESFGRGFDSLVELRPQEIQVGILKRLRGTPIARHDERWGMVYDEEPPYEILKTCLFDFETMQRMKRFARYWDIVANSGNFKKTLALLFSDTSSPFNEFTNFTDWLWKETGMRHGISLKAMTTFLWRYLCEVRELDQEATRLALSDDYTAQGRKDLPLELMVKKESDPKTTANASSSLKRQARHLRQQASSLVDVD